MPQLTHYAVAMCATFLLNLPFGYWRARLRKFSPAWFVAIHAPFRWGALPFFVAAYFGGQLVGNRWRLRQHA
jgi:hypothetical protein